MRTILIVASLTLWGCSSSATHLYTGDGHDRVSISCKRNQTNCYERANEECPYGWLIIGDNGHTYEVGGMAYTNRVGNAAITQYSTTTGYSGSLLVECKAPRYQQTSYQQPATQQQPPPKKPQEHEAPTLGQELGL